MSIYGAVELTLRQYYVTYMNDNAVSISLSSAFYTQRNFVGHYFRSVEFGDVDVTFVDRNWSDEVYSSTVDICSFNSCLLFRLYGVRNSRSF